MEHARLCEGVSEWEKWEAEGVEPIRNSSYEKELWKILDELDKLEAKTTKAKKKKEAAKVAKARANMGASSKQLGIKEIFAMKSGQRIKAGPKIAGQAPVSVARPAVKSITVIVPNLAPDPVSLAQTAVVDIVKSKTEGGICVSNNVIVPRLAPDQVSVAQPSDGNVSVTRLTPAR